MVIRGWGEEKWGVMFNECRGSLWEEEVVLEGDSNDGCTTV